MTTQEGIIKDKATSKENDSVITSQDSQDFRNISKINIHHHMTENKYFGLTFFIASICIEL